MPELFRHMDLYSSSFHTNMAQYMYMWKDTMAMQNSHGMEKGSALNIHME